MAWSLLEASFVRVSVAVGLLAVSGCGVAKSVGADAGAGGARASGGSSGSSGAGGIEGVGGAGGAGGVGGTGAGMVVRGTIGTLGERPPAAGGMRIRDDGLEFGDRTCSGSTCVKGGILP
jgi:hypothetical protein